MNAKQWNDKRVKIQIILLSVILLIHIGCMFARTLNKISIITIIVQTKHTAQLNKTNTTERVNGGAFIVWSCCSCWERKQHFNWRNKPYLRLIRMGFCLFFHFFYSMIWWKANKSKWQTWTILWSFYFSFLQKKIILKTRNETIDEVIKVISICVILIYTCTTKLKNKRESTLNESNGHNQISERKLYMHTHTPHIFVW